MELQWNFIAVHVDANLPNCPCLSVHLQLFVLLFPLLIQQKNVQDDYRTPQRYQQPAELIAVYYTWNTFLIICSTLILTTYSQWTQYFISYISKLNHSKSINTFFMSTCFNFSNSGMYVCICTHAHHYWLFPYPWFFVNELRFVECE
jgi:hypothetical protein